MDCSRLEATAFPARRMQHLTAAVIGAGALGNAVVQTLCMAGIKAVLVIDPDTVEPSNRTRSIFFQSPSARGENKASVIAETAGRMFPDTALTAFADEVADVPFEELAHADVWFSCVHSRLARVEIAYLAASVNRPVIDGGLGGGTPSVGRVSWFPTNGACFSCILPHALRARLLTLWDDNARHCGDFEDERPFPSTPSMAAIVAGLQVELGLRSFFDQQPASVSWRVDATATLQMEQVTHARSELCPFHWPTRSVRIALPERNLTVKELLASTACAHFNSPYVLLDWPLCVAAQCRACGASIQPLRRKSQVARRLPCPHCGRIALNDVESIRGISGSSAWAEYSLSALNVHGSVKIGHSGARA